MKLRIALALFLAALLTASVTDAQKLGKKYYEDAEYGYKVKFPKDWNVTPSQQTDVENGILVKFKTDLQTRAGKQSGSAPGSMMVVFLEEKLVEPTTGGGGLKKRVTKDSGNQDIADILKHLIVSGALRDFESDTPDAEKTVAFKKTKFTEVRHRTWGDGKDGRGVTNGSYELALDVWTFPVEGGELNLVFEIPENQWKKHRRVFEQVAKSMTRIEKESVKGLNRGSTYADLLAFHEKDASKADGWRAIATPSERFVIKTNSDNKKFIKEVIARVEASRDLFEEEYPPELPLTQVSVVRVFDNAEDFHNYGDTPAGVGGWFSPTTIELCLYDGVNTNRNETYAVMTHEAFHQYCHFLFGQAEAHRWFDEGHGDYFGAFEFKRGRAIPGKKMPGGFNRLPVIKQMFRDKTYKPLSEHLFYNHRQWQGQGPSNVSSYAQSWSIIYYLRMGTRGKVPKKIWKKEYADILPNYTKTLKEGFAEAYAEIREAIEADAEARGKTVTPGMLDLDRTSIDQTTKKKIWKAAMDASFGQVDLDEFQADWERFVDDEL